MRRNFRLMPRRILAVDRDGLRLGSIILICLFLSAIWPGYLVPYSNSVAVSAEKISIFAANCVTPKTSFDVGERVCVVALGAPRSSPENNYPQRRFQWVAPDGAIERQTSITSGAQRDVFTIPKPGQVGTWMVKTVDNSNGGFAAARFVVRDPANAAVDLSVNVFGPSETATSKNVNYTLQVNNNGPDNAQNVRLTNPTPEGATFISIKQDTGPAFTCANPAGKTVCSLASLDRGVAATFTVVYQIKAGTPDESCVSNTAEVSNSVTELHAPDNTSTAITTVQSGCAVGCPPDITRSSDFGKAGAIVNYSEPTASADICNPMVCQPESGSFFPVGVTTVVCGGQSGAPCSFTVNITRAFTMKLNGPDPLTVECQTAFDDPGATAQDVSGRNIPVTSSGPINMNKRGSYTITYLAGEGANTAAVTRTVNVVDTAAPAITLNGANPLMVEHSKAYTDPGVTAKDACAGIVPVITAGQVDVNRLGTYTITYTAGDGVDVSTARRGGRVVDTTAPFINCPANIEVTAAPGERAVVVNFTASARDSVSDVKMTSDPPSGSAFPIGTTWVTVTATDAAGNAARCPFSVTVINPARR